VTLPEPALPSPDLPAADPATLPGLLETLLFVSPAPVSVARLAEACGTGTANIESALADLSRSLSEAGRGIRMQRKDDRVSLTSAPEHAPYVERLLGLDPSARLSNAALEALAVIAYRQPITRTDIEAIRGVNCDGVLRTLIARELVEATGRLEQAGRPYLYCTTFQFLQYFGLNSLTELPALPEASTPTPGGPNLLD